MAAIDFATQGVKAANGRLFPGNFMTNLLIEAGINKLVMPIICRLIDKMGVFLAISGYIIFLLTAKKLKILFFSRTTFWNLVKSRRKFK